MGILCVFCVYDTIGNRCFEKTSFPKTDVKKCRLLITFANSLYPDQARHFVGPDLDPNCLTL